MTDRLLPCPVPWCGRQPRLHKKPGGEVFVVICIECGCGLPATHKSEAEAIAAWNSRPNNGVLDAAQKVADAWRESEFSRDSVAPDFGFSVDALAALLPAKGEMRNVRRRYDGLRRVRFC